MNKRQKKKKKYKPDCSYRYSRELTRLRRENNVELYHEWRKKGVKKTSTRKWLAAVKREIAAAKRKTTGGENG